MSDAASTFFSFGLRFLSSDRLSHRGVKSLAAFSLSFRLDSSFVFIVLMQFNSKSCVYYPISPLASFRSTLQFACVFAALACLLPRVESQYSSTTILNSVQCNSASAVAYFAGSDTFYFSCSYAFSPGIWSYSPTQNSGPVIVANSTQCSWPSTVAVSAVGNVYATCGTSSNGVAQVALDGTTTVYILNTKCAYPESLAITSTTLYSTCWDDTRYSVLSVPLAHPQQITVLAGGIGSNCQFGKAVVVSSTGTVFAGCEAMQSGTDSGGGVISISGGTANTVIAGADCTTALWLDLVESGSGASYTWTLYAACVGGNSFVSLNSAGTFKVLATTSQCPSGASLVVWSAVNQALYGACNMGKELVAINSTGGFNILESNTCVSGLVVAADSLFIACNMPLDSDQPSGFRVACDAGAVPTASSSGFCRPCSAGSYYPEINSLFGSATCATCPPGNFSGPGAAFCPACSVGRYNGNYGVSACVDCTPGRYNPLIAATSVSACQVCPPGNFSGSAAGSCTPCPAGAYNTAYGLSTCTECGAGSYNPLTGASSASACLLCPPGRYNPYNASAICAECVPDTYNPNEGAISASACLQCPPFFESDFGSAKCVSIFSTTTTTSTPNPHGPTSAAHSFTTVVFVAVSVLMSSTTAVLLLDLQGNFRSQFVDGVFA